jgi:predicted nucleic acid-binding protein
MAAKRTTNKGQEKEKAASVWGGLPPGATVLVDSAPFIYILESHPHFARQFIGLFQDADKGKLQIALSSITLAEVLTGPWQARKAALAKRYEKALSQYLMVPVSGSIAVLAAQLRAQYRLKLPDAIQLAAALEIGAQALVTHDRDFSRVKDLPVMMGDLQYGS